MVRTRLDQHHHHNAGRPHRVVMIIWIYDDSNTTISTDRFQIPLPPWEGLSFSYFFHDRWDGRINPDFTDVAIMNSSMTSILIADVLEDGP